MLNKKSMFIGILVVVAGLIGLQTEATPVEILQGQIEGTVVDAENGDPISDVEVKLNSGGEAAMGAEQTEETEQTEEEAGATSESEETATSDDEGAFTFEDVEAGSYTLQVNEDGYEDWEETVDVTEGSATEVNVELQSSEGMDE